MNAPAFSIKTDGKAQERITTIKYHKKKQHLNRDSRVFAKRMIADGIMPLNMISRLSGLKIEVIEEMAAKLKI